MAIRFDDYMAEVPKKRQQAIKKRTAELIAEEATLRQLREARERSQEEVAKKLHIKQAAVSEACNVAPICTSAPCGAISRRWAGNSKSSPGFPTRPCVSRSSRRLISRDARRGNVTQDALTLF